MNSARQAIRALLMAAVPKRMLLDRGRAESNRLYLTFDDGPHPEITPRVLDALHACGLRATFFVVGQEAERYPDLVRRIVAEGHALGTHSWSHAPAAETSARRLVDETIRTADLIAELTGVRTRWCRPPYGAVSARKLLALWRQNQTVVLWSNDPKDFQCETPDELQQRLLKAPPVAGDIVLLHDNRPAIAGCIEVLAHRLEATGCATGLIDDAQG